MEAPKCKICGSNHWGIKHFGMVDESTMQVHLTTTASNNASDGKQRWGRDKYNAYMKEYMRRKRGTAHSNPTR
jgi:ribosome-binding protein aMBF1 (putative translation factor)